MYLNALESQRISDTDTFSLIYLIYLPNQTRSTVQSYAFFLYCHSCVLKMSFLFINVPNITL